MSVYELLGGFLWLDRGDEGSWLHNDILYTALPLASLASMACLCALSFGGQILI